ncbi:hypothetical protein GWK47_024615 [Chionoecetes opilio]|uniref:Uncharacterized protein n=1 Tax=Chionoecetes opilio TaxID=41210 RepID=A0A8J5CDL8_CHIOP|nr:hypothetical protein GWK47_024615 [Chionoecetes opilio]
MMEDLSHPWPHLEPFFGPVVAKRRVIERGREKFKGLVVCKKCHANVSFNTNSLYTLKTHYNRLHPEDSKALVAAISGGSRRGKSTKDPNRGLQDVQPTLAEYSDVAFNNTELFHRGGGGVSTPSQGEDGWRGGGGHPAKGKDTEGQEDNLMLDILSKCEAVMVDQKAFVSSLSLESTEEACTPHASTQPAKKPKQQFVPMTHEQERDLAEWYAQHSLLYSTNKRKAHKDTGRKQYLYEEKAQELGLTVAQLQAWLEGMRSHYARLCEEGGQQESLGERDRWILSSFHFLRPHLMKFPAHMLEAQPYPSPGSQPSAALTEGPATHYSVEQGTEVADLSHPWPHLKPFFGPVTQKNRVVVKGKPFFKGIIGCKHCRAKLTFNTYSLYSLKIHYQRVHEELLEEFNDAVASASNRGRPPSLPPTPSDARVMQQPAAKAHHYAATFNAKKAQELFYRYMVGEMLPSRMTESPSLAAFLKLLNPHFKLPSRQTFITTLQRKAEAGRGEVAATLEGVRYVATTADCWTAHHRSFLGMTAHWIDPSNLGRQKAVLACKELPATHSCDVLANTVLEVHHKFHIEAKVTSVTTDNASNFVKAFKVLGDPEDPAATHAPQHTGGTHPAATQDQEDPEEREVQPVDLAQLLEEEHEYSSCYLPNPHRCAAHTLTLLATQDVETVPDWSTGHWPCFSKVTEKAQALWHKQDQKPTTTANIQGEAGRKPRTPDISRWYASMEVLSEALDTQLAQTNMSCMQNGIETFNQDDKDIIDEYLAVMKPVVTCLDKLQMEKEAYMGVLLPTLYVLRDSLRALESKPLKYARPLLQYLLENPLSDDKRPKGFKARFSFLFDNMDILMATAMHPLFKLPVVCLLNPEKVDAVKARLLCEVTEQAALDTSGGSSPDEDEEDDFFKALRSPGPTATEGTNSTRLSNKLEKELERWCSEKQKKKLLEQAMFPVRSRAAWVDVFIKYNTAIPSSAAVETLFSQGADVMKAKRTNLTSDNFERLVFMKGNMDLLKMELAPEECED